MTTPPPDPAPAERAAGSAAHAWRQRLFWDWAQAIPASMPGGFLSTLYASAAAADAGGQLKYAKGGKAIPIARIASGARVDVKDCRRYLNAAIAAGVIVVVGEKRSGAATLYALLLSPFPDWEAAAAVLKASKRRRADQVEPRAERARAANLGGHAPVVAVPREEVNLGGVAPYVWDDEAPPLEDEPRGPGPLPTPGATPPRGWGATPPTVQVTAFGFSMTGAEVVTQAEVPGPSACAVKINSIEQHDDAGCAARRCPRCGAQMSPTTKRTMCVGCLREDQPA